MKKTSKKECEALLAAKEQMLVLFSGDQRLKYTVYETGDVFHILPEKQQVLVPLSFFEDNPDNQNRLLFHLYQTLALYPDWQKNASVYLSRKKTFMDVIDRVSQAYLAKVKESGLKEDPAYSKKLVKEGVWQELSSFLDDVDAWYAALIVMSLAPVYQNHAVKEDIAHMLDWEEVFPFESSEVHTHRDLAKSLTVMLFYDEEQIGNPMIRSFLMEPVFHQQMYAFLQKQVLSLFHAHEGITERDPLMRAFLVPEWVKLFEQDISHMELIHTQMHKSEEQKKPTVKKRSSAMRQKDKEAMLQQLEQQQKRAKAQADLIHGTMKLSEFGVTAEDVEIFAHYERKTGKARNEMKRFWMRLIGEASQEVSIKVEGTDKGKLDVPLLIRSWPDFVEAQSRQNYKELHIFDSYELNKVPERLPQYLDISFVIDNSGSMKSGKVPYAREALAVVLLSLQDFSRYLLCNAEALHQKMQIRTETWLFGTECRRILSFEDTYRKQKADTVLSIARLNGSGGSTDDGACLNEILKQITPQEQREMESGRRMRLIFEVTDGASSFPGTTRKAVRQLQKMKAEIQAVEIGIADDPESRRIFSYIFEDHGTYLGSRSEQLPKVLTASVESQLSTIFRKHSAMSAN